MFVFVIVSYCISHYVWMPLLELGNSVIEVLNRIVHLRFCLWIMYFYVFVCIKTTIFLANCSASKEKQAKTNIGSGNLVINKSWLYISKMLTDDITICL